MSAASNQNLINNSFAPSPLQGTAHLIAKVYLYENGKLYHYSGKNNSENGLNLDSVLMVTSKEYQEKFNILMKMKSRNS